METTRREFFRIAAVGGVAATAFGFDLKPAYAQLKELKIARATETRSTCPYCAVGCGVLIYTLGDRRRTRGRFHSLPSIRPENREGR